MFGELFSDETCESSLESSEVDAASLSIQIVAPDGLTVTATIVVNDPNGGVADAVANDIRDFIESYVEAQA